jgi:hypothetical protein
MSQLLTNYNVAISEPFNCAHVRIRYSVWLNENCSLVVVVKYPGVPELTDIRVSVVGTDLLNRASNVKLQFVTSIEGVRLSVIVRVVTTWDTLTVSDDV